MTKRLLYPLLICLLTLGLTACGLDVVEFDVVETGGVGGAALNFPGMANFSTGLGRALSDKDVDPGDVDSMKVLEVSLRMTSQGGLTQDLSFIEDMEFSAEADGLPTARIAFQASIAEGVREVQFQVEDNLELKPYLEAGNMAIQVQATLNPPPPDLVELEVTFKIRVDVDLT